MESKSKSNKTKDRMSALKDRLLTITDHPETVRMINEAEIVLVVGKRFSQWARGRR